MTHGPQLIAYADRLGGSIAGLTRTLREQFDGAFAGVHVLPFFEPFDGADAGFDPRDHTSVDSRLGTWADVRELATQHQVMADVIVNHMSSDSDAFRDVRERGDDSPWAGMFLTMSSIFPDGATEDELAMIYRPRPGLPFTTMRLGGRTRLVWTTFTPQQVDLDVRHELTWDYLYAIVDRLTGNGVRQLRLDAIGYAGKTAGTDCFMTEDTAKVLARIADRAHERDAQVLLEIHGHHAVQIDTAQRVDMVYDFALPPLVLHALLAHDARPLARWLEIRPTNCVTVLDTHDGIGVVDVASDDEHGQGLLSDDQITALIEMIHDNSGGTSRSATGAAASNLDLYQVNCTLYDALGADDDRLVLARLIQLFLPGVPQVYYVGLLAGRNDMELLARTGTGRDVNRHHYTEDEVAAQLGHPAVLAQLAACRFRATHPAFHGEFSADVSDTTMTLTWRSGDHRATLVVDVVAASYEITHTVAGSTRRTARAAELTLTGEQE